MASSKQTITTYTIFDYFYDVAGNALAGIYVYLRPTQTVANVSPVVYLPPVQQRARTDSNGYASWTVAYNQGAQEYTITWPGKAVRMVVTSGAGPFQVSANLASDSA